MSMIKDVYDVAKDIQEIYDEEETKKLICKAIENGKIGRCFFCGGLIDRKTKVCKHCGEQTGSFGNIDNYIIEINEESVNDENRMYYIGKYSGYKEATIMIDDKNEE